MGTRVRTLLRPQLLGEGRALGWGRPRSRGRSLKWTVRETSGLKISLLKHFVNTGKGTNSKRTSANTGFAELYLI